MKTTILSTFSLLAAICVGVSAEFTTTERVEDHPGGKRIFTDFQRSGRIIMTRMSAPEEAQQKGLKRVEAFYVYLHAPIKDTDLTRKIPAMQVFVFGDRIMKSAGYNNGVFSGSADFIDVDGDGRDDVLRLVEHPDQKNGLLRSRLIDAFTVSPSGEVAPMHADALAQEIARYDSEKNG